MTCLSIDFTNEPRDKEAERIKELELALKSSREIITRLVEENKSLRYSLVGRK